MRCPFSSFAITVILLVGGSVVASAQNVIIPPSSVGSQSDDGAKARTFLSILTPLSGPAVSTAGPPFPGIFYETPASIACIYDLQPPSSECNPYLVHQNPAGGSKAIAVVDAFDDPNISTDLQTFSTQFGIVSATFQVVWAPAGGATPGSCMPGPAPQPPTAMGTGWDVEESLDTEWAHAMAPGAGLYLVEAQSNLDKDLFCAVSVASALVNAAGGGEVSMSWGGSEFPAETLVDSIFTTPNVVYFAASGDGPGAYYPSVSPNVVAAGGTSLPTNPATGAWLGLETTWQPTGGGLSLFEPLPSWQASVPALAAAGRRGTPDVVSDANPYTGLWVADTLTAPITWYIVGGTSAAAPLWAAIANVSETMAGAFASSSQAELNRLYAAPPTKAFHAITTGNCGLYMSQVASAGWNFCSGLGSPHTYGGK